MKPSFFFVFSLLVQVLVAQEFSCPEIQKNARNVEELIPENWVLIDSASGDLTGDELKDFALVLQSEITTKDSLNRPRILVVAFSNEEGGLSVVSQHNEFIIDTNTPQMEDPFSGIAVKDGMLEISFHFFYNMGSWYVSSATYQFLYLHDEFKLIAAEKISFHRVTHDSEKYNFNFLSNEWREEVTKAGDETPVKTELHQFYMKPMPTLENLSRPLEWEVVPGVFI